MQKLSDCIAKSFSTSRRIPKRCTRWLSYDTNPTKYEQAVDFAHRAVETKPEVGLLHYTLGATLNALGRYEQAVEAYQTAIRLQPDLAQAHYNLGNSLGRLGKYTEAVERYRRSLDLAPSEAFAWFNMGVALQRLGRHEEAIDAFKNVLRLGHDPAEAHKAIAASCHALAGYERTIFHYRQALTFKPNDADTHSNLGMAMLQTGCYEQGWKEYSWRLRKVAWIESYRDVPMWDGSQLEGRRLLVRSEQGFGDNIQFVRYLPMAKERGAKIILATYNPLVELMKTAKGCDVVVSENDSILFDVFCPLMELPRIVQTKADTIPANVPYLHADPSRAARWTDRISPDQLNVGIVWGASPLDKRAQARSCRLSDFVRLAENPNVRLWGLQKGPAAEQVRQLPPTSPIINLGDEFSDFADTAGAIANMDLVISVDTSVLHLAGALGKPVWALTLFSPDWRWMSGGTTNPWYPTMRMFRQSKAGCWRDVFEKVDQALGQLASQRRSRQ